MIRTLALPGPVETLRASTPRKTDPFCRPTKSLSVAWSRSRYVTFPSVGSAPYRRVSVPVSPSARKVGANGGKKTHGEEVEVVQK